jgi:hypothetical protein
MVKKMDMERFNLKQLKRRKLRDSIRLQSKTSLQLRKTYDDNGDIIRAWDTIREPQNFDQREYRSLRIEVS